QILDQTLDNRLAGETYFSNAAVDAAHRQPYAEPCREKLRDLGARQPVAHRQSGDESGQRRPHEARLGRPQVALAAVYGRYQAHGRVEGLATVFRGAVDYPKLARTLQLPDQQFVTFAQTVG